MKNVVMVSCSMLLSVVFSGVCEWGALQAVRVEEHEQPSTIKVVLPRMHEQRAQRNRVSVDAVRFFLPRESQGGEYTEQQVYNYVGSNCFKKSLVTVLSVFGELYRQLLIAKQPDAELLAFADYGVRVCNDMCANRADFSDTQHATLRLKRYVERLVAEVPKRVSRRLALVFAHERYQGARASVDTVIVSDQDLALLLRARAQPDLLMALTETDLHTAATCFLLGMSVMSTLVMCSRGYNLYPFLVIELSALHCVMATWQLRAELHSRGYRVPARLGLWRSSSNPPAALVVNNEHDEKLLHRSLTITLDD